MSGIVGFIARLIRALVRMYERKWSFLGVSIVIFALSVLALSVLGLLPSPRAPAEPEAVLGASAVADAELIPEDPIEITIPAIALKASVANPATTDIKILDQNLLTGAVRYPTSARLGEAGNVVLFGHSSYLPVVSNQSYKAFNGIQKLATGDLITVHSATAAYTYRVKGVMKESAASDAGINLTVTGRELTLATCDSFGAKSDRFIVTADFVESQSLPS